MNVPSVDDIREAFERDAALREENERLRAEADRYREMLGQYESYAITVASALADREEVERLRDGLAAEREYLGRGQDQRVAVTLERNALREQLRLRPTEDALRSSNAILHEWRERAEALLALVVEYRQAWDEIGTLSCGNMATGQPCPACEEQERIDERRNAAHAALLAEAASVRP